MCVHVMCECMCMCMYVGAHVYWTITFLFVANWTVIKYLIDFLLSCEPVTLLVENLQFDFPVNTLSIHLWAHLSLYPPGLSIEKAVVPSSCC